MNHQQNIVLQIFNSQTCQICEEQYNKCNNPPVQQTTCKDVETRGTNQQRIQVVLKMYCTSYIHLLNRVETRSLGSMLRAWLWTWQDLWYQSLRLLMWAQILSAGPSLMFMVDMRCSSFSSSRAWPSISCDRNWEAISSQPAERRKRDVNRERNVGTEDETKVKKNNRRSESTTATYYSNLAVRK